MAPLQGYTLGQRHKYYNELVKEATARNTSEIPKINYEEDDVDNMIKIDISCKERNVEYVLQVFQCDDMLYVSRAINRSTWLITEPQYAHIVCPKYLHNELFPRMNAKAVTKLMLQIRRHLKDELRVKAFYRYVYEKNPIAALHWLGNCPLKFIEEVVATRTHDIPVKLIKRLCRQSLSILRIYLENFRFDRADSNIIHESKHFLKHKETVEDFLDLACCYRKKTIFNFNAKYTHILMKYCPEKIKGNFTVYRHHIHLTTFVKYLKINEIKPFLMTIERSFETLTPFLVKLPREEVLEFLAMLHKIEYVDSKHTSEKDKSDVEALFYAIEGRSYGDFSKIYRWYRIAPFEIAFRDIKKFISAESEPEQRHSLLIVLLTCASYDFRHVRTVLQYYHHKHINEPHLHKKKFINSLLSQQYAFRFDDDTWNILNALFYSSEVYIESGNDVQAYLIPIIVRSVLRDQPVHEVVEDKFKIESLVSIKSELNPQEQDKVFNYLYKLLVKKINLQRTDSETGMRKVIELLKSIWVLINDWDKANSHHRFVIDKIAELGEINNTSPWVHEMKNKNRRKRRKRKLRSRYSRYARLTPKVESQSIEISSIYKMVKTYRKDLIEKSLVLHASEEALLNALKHDPELLARSHTEIHFLRTNDEISLKRFLTKLRTYWSDSLALEWTEKNKERLKKLSGHRALVRGLLTLMPHNEALNFIKTYAPVEKKIDWSEAGENAVDLSLTKHVAQKMHIARPQVNAEVVLWYAKGDYLQYALLSLRTMYYNLKSSEIRKYISLMLDAPVSLQKHGIRLVFDKYKTDEKIKVASKLWNKSQNSSIRTILFISIFNLLCNEKRAIAIKTIWTLLSSFIDGLNDEENKNIYSTLGKVVDVPVSVVGEFYQKAYFFLKSLPEKADVSYILACIIDKAETLIEYLDSEFVETSLLHSISVALEKYNEFRECVYLKILSAYLLCSKTLDIQLKKYNNVLQPVIDDCLPRWVNGEKHLVAGFQSLLGHICSKIPHFVFDKDMLVPVEILANIKNALLKGSWCIKEEYIMIRRWEFTVRYIEKLSEMREAAKERCWERTRTESAQHMATMCFDYITEDQRKFFPSIYLIFKYVLKSLFEAFDLTHVDQLQVLCEMMKWKDCSSMYLLAIEMIPDHCYGWDSDIDDWTNKVKKMIYSHPSEEVTMHYFKRFSDKYSKDKDIQDNNSDEDTE